MKNRQVSYKVIPISTSPDRMINKRMFTTEEAGLIRAWLKINWSQINLEQFRRGLEVELKHGADDPEINAARETPTLIGKVA